MLVPKGLASEQGNTSGGQRKVYYLALLGLSLFAAFISRIVLPEEPNLWGIIDDMSLAALTGALLGATSLLKKPLGSTLGLLAVVLIFLLGFVNGWYFEFYRGYVGLTSWELLSDLGEPGKSIGALYSPLGLALGGMTFAVICYTYAASTWPDWVAKLKVIALALVVLVALQVAHGFRPSKQFHPTSENFLPRLMREAISRAREPVASRQFVREGGAAVEKLIPRRKGWRRTDVNYPLYLIPDRGTESPRHPLNVLLIVMEGVRASEMGIYGNDRSATPQLDEISKEGLLARQYYSNSTQTVRAEVNILCGVLDRLGGAPFSTGGLSFGAICLPDILRRLGYATYWFHGYRRSFFSRGKFFPKLGFERLYDEATLRPFAPPGAVIGWGFNDSFVFDHALSVLEKERRPFFAEIMTLSNHFPFDWPWGIRFPSTLRGSARELFYNYRRGIYYTDHAVGQFWRKFKQSKLAKDTIVIFVGDHGIWTFDPERRKRLSDFNRHEQYFRTPFIAVGPHIQPETLEIPVSHVDVQPTVLSWLGIYTPTATIGRAFAGPEQTLATRSVFTLIEGSYGYRMGNTYCVPTEMSCFQEMFPRCAPDQKPRYGRACVETKVDPLFALLDDKNAKSLPDYDLTEPDRLLTYMQRALEEGDFMPRSKAEDSRDPVIPGAASANPSTSD